MEANVQTSTEAQTGKAMPQSEAEAEAGEEATKTEAKAKADAETAVETKNVLIRHKTPYPKYRIAGLVLTQKPETYQVTEAQLEKLRRDPWVVIEPERK
jgi:hypothetical protein